MPKKYSFFNLPIKRSRQDYKEATDTIASKYSKINGLVSIYSWGKISNPGISDIDILLIFKNNPKPLPFSRRSFYFLNEKARYLARHPFVFISEESFKKIRYVYPDTNFQLLHGKCIKINGISGSEKYFSIISLLNDIIIRHYPRDFIKQSADNSINVRDTLLRLNSLKYSIGMLEFLSKQKLNEWRDNLKRIEDLRTNWFDDKDYGELVELNENALGITIGFVEQFRGFLAEKGLIKIKGSNIFYNGIKNKTLFVKNWDKKNALKKDYSVLPIELSAQLVKYSNSDGMISHYIRKNLDKRPECSLKHIHIVEKRINILNKQAELAYKLKHSDFAAYFDFGYRNSSGINNWFLKLTDRLRF